MNFKFRPVAGFVAALLFASSASAATVSFGATVTDIGSPSSFIFNFSNPVTPFSGLVDITDSLTVVVTDATGNGASATGILGLLNSLMAGFSLPSNTNLGVDIGNSCTVAPSTILNNTNTCSFSGFNTMSWTALDNMLSGQIGFLASGDGDTVALTGSLTVVDHVNRVPEPGSLAILGLGLAGLAFKFGRRKQA